MAASPEPTIMEVREELMVSPTGGNPTLRTGHFLKPTLNSSEPLPPLSLSSRPAISGFKKPPLKVIFMGRHHPQEGWKKWVHRLEPLYKSTWKKAGIYEAILGSTYQTLGHNDLIIGLAERWCIDTNTFVFPWGEVTITLEDMLILGGFSLLGESVLRPLNNKKMIEIEENLINTRRDLRLNNTGRDGQFSWMNHFMKIGGRFEHEAFLSLWLSRYVFPANYNTVRRNVFPIAISLSRGTQIALAPAVLASIYRDLSLLKKSICDSSENHGLRVTLLAPFQLVQLWAWERFSSLGPNPNSINLGEPRTARWHRVSRLKVNDLRKEMDSAIESFNWRPYARAVNNLKFSKFYRESEEWVLVESHMEKELESFARCLRVSELVGLDCMEIYLPHRVAMQFGMDQDVPSNVSRPNVTPRIAWRNYSRPIIDTKLYVPPRLFESDVTQGYLEWWKQSILAMEDGIKGVVRRDRSKTYKRRPGGLGGNKKDEGSFLPPNFISKCRKDKRLGRNKEDNNDFPSKRMTNMGIKGDKDDNNDFPPGFPSKCTKDMDIGGNKDNNHDFPSICMKVVDVDEDKLTLAELLRLRNKSLPNSSFSAVDNGDFRKLVSLIEPMDMKIQDKALMGSPKREMEVEIVSETKSPSLCIKSNDQESNCFGEIEIPILELESRISKLEKLVAGLRAKKIYRVVSSTPSSICS